MDTDQEESINEVSENLVNEEVDADSPDSSEEEEETDEETYKKESKGFIVDDEETEDEGNVADDSDDEILEDDLDLLAENSGQHKRLKRGHSRDKDVSKIFDEDEEELGLENHDNDSDFIVDDYEEAAGLPMEYEHTPQPKLYKQSESYRYIDNDAKSTWHYVFSDLDGLYIDALDSPEPTEDIEFASQGIKAILDPNTLKAMMMTDEDNEIREKDLPERIQLRTEIPTDYKLSEAEVRKAAKWISNKLFKFRDHRIINQNDLLEAVKNVVRHISQEFYEVPFIFTYKRDEFVQFVDFNGRPNEILTREDLWIIYDLEYTFRKFLERRKYVKEFMDKYSINDDYINGMTVEATNVDELNDLLDYSHLKYGSEIASKSTPPTQKRRTKNSFYRECCKRGVGKLTKKFGIDIEKYGESLSSDHKTYWPIDPDKSIKEEALQLNNFNENRANLFIKDAVRMLSQEIATTPPVRKFVRSYYLKHANVVICPNKILTEEDKSCWSFRFLKKPIQKFANSGQFAEILKAEDDEMIKVSIELDDKEKFLRRLKEYIVSDNATNDPTINEWNKYRMEAVDQAYSANLVPFLNSWLRTILKNDAEQWIMEKLMLSLENKINFKPFRPAGSSRRNDTSAESSSNKNDLPSVLAISWGAGGHKANTECVLVGSQGEVMDTYDFGDLKSGQEDFFGLLNQYKPEVVVVKCYDIKTKYLLETVQTFVKEYNDEKNGYIPVMVVNDELAHIYKNSKAAIKEHHDRNTTEVTRYCIALARTIQDPLNAYASLGELLADISHHPLQKLLPKEKALQGLERALINIISQVGVNINDAIRNPYKAEMLKYVCGLGPRKVDALLKILRFDDHEEVTTRKDLESYLGKNIVYHNCIPFIRIYPKPIEYLDNTRILPQHYIHARKMVTGALELGDDEIEDDNEIAIKLEDYKKLKLESSKLNDLNIEDYVTRIKDLDKSATLFLIHMYKKELLDPFEDYRRSFEPLKPEEVFAMLTGETEETLAYGMVIPVTITNIKPKFVEVKLLSDLRGTILPSKNEKNFEIGQMVMAKVLKVDKEKFSVILTTRHIEHDDDDEKLDKTQLDDYFDHEAKKEYIEPKPIIRETLIPKVEFIRTLDHPYFVKVKDYKEAENHLAEKPNGEIIIRPSSKGYNHLAITWKVWDDIYQHIDIIERTEDKDGKEVVSFTVAGGKDVYSDIDELIVTYVEPIYGKVEELTSHIKYKPSKEILNYFLESSLRSNPRMSLYGFTLDRQRPAYFIFSYKIKPDTPIVDLVKIQECK
ncbi:6375_t:CDS:10 [Entrophospora sp. SA101]|nr:6375_t:CDS:10 [Entrophospora sp. SA101]